MKKSEPKARVRKRAFRLEWEERSGGDGTLYLDGVLSFGEFAEKRKRFLTGVGVVSVFGERLSVLTFR